MISRRIGDLKGRSISLPVSSVRFQLHNLFIFVLYQEVKVEPLQCLLQYVRPDAVGLLDQHISFTEVSMENLALRVQPMSY